MVSLAKCLAVAAAVLLAPLPALAQKVLRVAMHGDVRTLDPVWTTQTIAAIHGMMVYDTLFSSDHDQNPKPQMVDTWTMSPDRLVYTFKLREGLKFHDGTPVTSKDVVASMNRWGKRDGAGKQLMGYTKSLVAKDARTFEWTLTEPYGFLIDTLAKTGVHPGMQPGVGTQPGVPAQPPAATRGREQRSAERAGEAVEEPQGSAGAATQ